MLTHGRQLAVALMMLPLLGLQCLGLPVADNNTTYWQQREQLLQEDYSNMIGSNLTLSADEERVNDLLKSYLQAEMSQAFNTLNFPPATNFMLSKQTMEGSQVFALIKDMPKGAILHIHDTALTSIDYVINELTYWDNLYVCYEGGFPTFRYSASVPSRPCSSGTWVLVADERAAYSSPEEYDAELYRLITLIVDDPHTEYPNINAVWERFGHYFAALDGIYTYRPAFQAYMGQAFTELYQDGVSYFEFRTTLPQIYELDGTILDPIETMQVVESTIQDLVQNNSQKIYGARCIYAPSREVSVEQVEEYVSLAAQLRTQFPDTVAGLDLVGQEDLGVPLKDFIEPLLTVAELNVSMPVFYHAGETNWYGVSTDENIADAILLNTSRIGHGYAILKHPALMKRARENDIPIEVNPVSNQVLKLVEDLRNHPAIALAAQNFPMVVSSDDPAAWGALPLSHDFYEAIMVFAGNNGDLRFLKQLAINSIKYSSLGAIEKTQLMSLWQQQWDEFITRTINERMNNTLFRWLFRCKK